MPIDFSELALSPNESRAARNYFGLSQAQAAAKSNLPVHKLKRFETGTYVPDNEFLQQLREFFEGRATTSTMKTRQARKPKPAVTFSKLV